jgi:hypothetical protein
MATTTRVTQILVTGESQARFSILVEPEGVEYTFPPQERVLLTFRGPDSVQQFEISHQAAALTVWRPGDTQVWATLADGSHEQIGGFSDNPAPWIDSGHAATGPAPWTWPEGR